MEIVAQSYADAYEKLRNHFLSEAVRISPRGIETIELCNVSITILNPRSRLGYNEKRKFSLPFAVAESILLFTPTNSLSYIEHVNPRMKNFSDDNKTLHGSYGYRIADFIETIILKLKEDPTTRQAVLCIYQRDDLISSSKDIPCSVFVQFMIRNDKLHCFVTMRSNDFFWGFPYDMFQFSVLQEIIANDLRINVGNYYHRANSLHVYTEKHGQLLADIEKFEPVEFSIPYTTLEMYSLALEVINMKFYPPKGQLGIFSEILRSFELRKRKIQQEEISQEWAKKFLKG